MEKFRCLVFEHVVSISCVPATVDYINILKDLFNVAIIIFISFLVYTSLEIERDF